MKITIVHGKITIFHGKTPIFDQGGPFLAVASTAPDARVARLATAQAAADGQGQAQVGAHEEDAALGEDGGPGPWRSLWRSLWSRHGDLPFRKDGFI
jgi:hypothetical protein